MALFRLYNVAGPLPISMMLIDNTMYSSLETVLSHCSVWSEKQVSFSIQMSICNLAILTLGLPILEHSIGPHFS